MSGNRVKGSYESSAASSCGYVAVIHNLFYHLFSFLIPKFPTLISSTAEGYGVFPEMFCVIIYVMKYFFLLVVIYTCISRSGQSPEKDTWTQRAVMIRGHSVSHLLFPMSCFFTATL